MPGLTFSHLKNIFQSDSHGIWTHNHLVCKWTLNHLAKLSKWLSCFVSTYLCGAFDSIFTSRMHFRVNPHSIVAWMSRNSYHVRELSGCGFEFCCCHLNFRHCICFKKRVPWHSGNCRVWIHSEMCMWHDNNIQSNAPYR